MMTSIESAEPTIEEILRQHARPRGALAAERWVRGFSGYAFAWPWFDGFSAWVLRRLYFPASRLWAAAQLAEGDPAGFWGLVPMQPRAQRAKRLAAALAAFDRARARANALDAEWQRVFFGREETSANYRRAVEAARLDGRHAYNATRRLFLFLLNNEVPCARPEHPTPLEMAEAYRPAQQELAPFVAPPDQMPSVEVSQEVPTAAGADYWIRFKSPASRPGDTVYARVHEPLGVSDAPTIIFGHGIAVEFDHWRGRIDEADTLRKQGFRVIRPEAAWHGRRTPAGYFGGERIVSTYPAGLLDVTLGAVREWAVLADWSRRTSRGALAFGGTSLGAQIAQLAADRAREWPERLRPEGLFLITHCGEMAAAAQHGEMARIVGGTEEAERRGWSLEAAEAYAALLDPRPEPPVAPSKIVTVLGRRDVVTPFASALSLIDGWRVPDMNRFVWDRGHFSIPMTMIRDAGPVARFRNAMG